MSDKMNDYENAISEDTPMEQEVIPYSEDELVDSLKEEPKEEQKPRKKRQHVSWQLFRK